MEQLHFHIGPHKTATTRIQHVLQDQVEALAGQGVGLANVGVIRNLAGNDLRRARVAGGKMTVEAAAAELAARKTDPVWKQPRVIATFENVVGGMMDVLGAKDGVGYPRVGDRLAVFAKLFEGTPTRIFCAVREYGSFYASCYSQHVRNGGVEPAEDLVSALDGAVMRWPEFLRRVQGAWPGAELCVWDYGAYRAREPELLNELAFGAEIELPDPGEIHTSLSSGAAAALRALWGPLGEVRYQRKRRIANSIAAAMPASEYGRLGFFGDEDRERLAGLYAEDLQEIAAMDGVAMLLSDA